MSPVSDGEVRERVGTSIKQAAKRRYIKVESDGESSDDEPLVKKPRVVDSASPPPQVKTEKLVLIIRPSVAPVARARSESY